MATEFEIRRITREDAAWKKAFEDFYAGCPVRRAGCKLHAYFAAYSGGALAGCALVLRDNGRWLMDGLLVKPEFREKGIAKRLTEARIRFAVSRGASEIWYSCEDGNLVTACCHMRYGFEKVCREHHCEGALARWYRLEINDALFEKFPVLRPEAAGAGL